MQGQVYVRSLFGLWWVTMPSPCRHLVWLPRLYMRVFGLCRTTHIVRHGFTRFTGLSLDESNPSCVWSLEMHVPQIFHPISNLTFSDTLCYLLAMPKTSDRIKLKTFKKVVIMTDVVDAMVYAIMQETGTPNYSQAVRDAIFQRHRSVKPPYLEPSVDQQKKRQKLVEDQKIADMTDEEYVTDVIHGNLLTDDSGAKFCVVHFYANTIKAIPLAEVRKYFADWPADLDFHLAKLSEIPIESLIEQETHRAYLKKNFNVDIVV